VPGEEETGAAGFCAAGAPPKIIVERGASSSDALGAAGGAFGREGMVAAGAGFAGAGHAGGWLKTMVPLGEGSGAGAGREGAPGPGVPGNIIVRPAASSAAGGRAGALGNIIVRPAASSAAGVAPVAGRGDGFGAADGAAKIIVELPAGAFAGAATGGDGGAAAGGCGAGARVTLNVFWHLPQRMVRPCGPIRLSSTR
jgi:hypothetical protein